MAALCEEVEAEGGKQKAESEVESRQLKTESKLDSNNNSIALHKVHSSAKLDSAQRDTIQVYTTLANGKEELPYQNGETKIVDGVKVEYFKRVTKDHSHFSPSLLSHLWKNAKNFDVIHIHSWWNLVSIGAVCICLLKGIIPIISPRGMLGDYTISKSKSIFHRFFGKYLLRKCNFHATTNMEATEINNRVFSGYVEVIDLMLEGDIKLKVESNNYIDERAKSKEQRVKSKEGLRKIFVIHNIVNLLQELPIKTRVFDGTLNLIFLSRIHHKKGIELLLDALALVNFPFQLRIVGQGDLHYVESLRLKVEGLKLNDKVTWHGAVYGDEKYYLLAQHDAFILPSYNENFANVVVESIAVGTPVLISDKVGLKDYVLNNNFGLAFKLEELREALDTTYSILRNGKGNFNMIGFKSQQTLIENYLEMYKQV